jgi:hypothetical protein
MDGGFDLIYSSIRVVAGCGIVMRILSGLRSERTVVGLHKDRHGNRLTRVNIPAFTMKVVQSEKDLFYYSFRNGDSKPVLSMRSKVRKARAQGVCYEAYMAASLTIRSETVSEGQTVAESGTVGIRVLNLPV